MRRCRSASSSATSTDREGLHRWIRDLAARSGTPQYHHSGTNDESCTVGVTPQRTYMALEVCKTGVERAACVEADEEIEAGIVHRVPQRLLLSGRV